MPDKLGEFLSQHDWELYSRIKGWKVERDTVDTNVLRFYLRARDGEQFTVRCVCDNYPEHAPSVKFINVQGSTEDKAAWPRGNNQFHEVIKLPPESFLCTDLTREGFAHHNEWVNKPTAWNGTVEALMTLFNYINDLLNSKDYESRAK